MLKGREIHASIFPDSLLFSQTLRKRKKKNVYFIIFVRIIHALHTDDEKVQNTYRAQECSKLKKKSV